MYKENIFIDYLATRKISKLFILCNYLYGIFLTFEALNPSFFQNDNISHAKSLKNVIKALEGVKSRKKGLKRAK